MDAYVVTIAKQSLYMVLLLSGPPVLAAMTVGLLVSIMQATTQIQEQSLTFVPKLIAIFAILGIFGPLGFVQLMEFTRSLLENFYRNIN